MKEERKQEGSSVRLKDQKFPWKSKKTKAYKLAEIFDAAGYEQYADRERGCCMWLLYDESLDRTERRLKSANFCDLRLCPLCAGRRAKKMSYKLSKIMDYVEAEHGCRYIFLTLTVRNCKGKDLGATIDLLTRGWVKLIRHRSFERAVHGWFRAIEVTRNAEENTYHPHIHAILAVMPEYFKHEFDFFLDQLQWRRHWQVAAGLNYDPSVYISKTRGRKKSKRTDTPSESASKEAAKYATKDKEFLDPELSVETAAEIVSVYTRALHKRRLTAFGGWLKDAAKKFEADDLEFSTDLVHIDEDSVRDDLLELVVRYEWNFGEGDYILASREINPEYVDPGTGELRAPSGPEKQEVSDSE